MYTRQVKELKGHTLTDVSQSAYGDDVIVFTRDDGVKVRMYHEQDCCECVVIEDIEGDLEDLVGSEILEAEEVTDSAVNDCGDSVSWTFYKIGTAKGFVNIRWVGESNGYYSESVDIECIYDEDKRGYDG